MRDIDRFIKDYQDAEEKRVRLSDPAIIEEWVGEFPDIDPPSLTFDDILSKEAELVGAFFADSVAASGGAIIAASADSAREQYRQIRLGSSGGGQLEGINSLLGACEVYFLTIQFETGKPIRNISADTKVQVVLPDRASLAMQIDAKVKEINIEEFEPPIEYQVLLARQYAEQRAKAVWETYADRIKTTHTGPDSTGAPQTVEDQPTT